MNIIGYISCERPADHKTMAGREEVREVMTNNGIVQIHGKEYMTVARRVELARQENALEGVETEILSHNPVVVRAKVTVKGKIFTGISSVNQDSGKLIEKQNPYEVAETSAVGRALGFAGFGLVESIASADEMVKAENNTADRTTNKDLLCDVCGNPAVEKQGTTKTGKAYHGIFCSTDEKSHTRWIPIVN